MSFILDALRKSETERRRGATPGIAQIPLAARPPALPAWAIALIAFLGMAVLALGAAWWRDVRLTQPTTARARAVPLELPPPGATQPATLPSVALQPAATIPVASVGSAGDPPVAAHASTAAVQPVEAKPVPTPPATPPRPSSAPPDTHADQAPSLLSPAALAAQGITVPKLRLELHAYSDRPSERYVFINGSKYVEGDRLAEGPRVVAIEPKGVVLSDQGRRFLLAPE